MCRKEPEQVVSHCRTGCGKHPGQLLCFTEPQVVSTVSLLVLSDHLVYTLGGHQADLVVTLLVCYWFFVCANFINQQQL